MVTYVSINYENCNKLNFIDVSQVFIILTRKWLKRNINSDTSVDLHHSWSFSNEIILKGAYINPEEKNICYQVITVG